MSKTTYKRGTIGYAAQALANKHGKSTTGIYILSRALELALSSDDDLFYVTGIYKTKVHRELCVKEHEFLLELARKDGARDQATGRLDCQYPDGEFRNAWCEGFNNASPSNMARTTV